MSINCLTKLFTIFNILQFSYGLETCYSRYCDYYCCDSYSLNQYCCRTCSISFYYKTACNNQTYTTNYWPIVGGIAGSVVFCITVSLIIAICCGYICSGRTGIQRRGRIIQAPDPNVMVINPVSQYPYPLNPEINLDGQYPYPVSQQVINPYYPNAPPPYPTYPTNQVVENPAPQFNPEVLPSVK